LACHARSPSSWQGCRLPGVTGGCGPPSPS
jgi:hypothetical protein